MQAGLFNNPMFGQALSGLIQNAIGDPVSAAQAEVLASQALLNNQTAQYRDEIGNEGLSGDLAAMMIRSLQAGPEYSGNAPGIGQAAVGFNMMGYGNLPTRGLPPMPGAPSSMPPSGGAAPRPQAPAPQPAPPPMGAGLPLLAPPQSSVMQYGPMEELILNQARESMMQVMAPEGRAAIIARLQAFGIDPARL